MSCVNKKRVAIIGAGASGLVAAKYAQENGLQPVVFESKNTLGGIWSPEHKHSAIWDGLITNVSRYMMAFSDHQHPENSEVFCNKEDVYNYLVSYLHKFKLEECIKYNTDVIKIIKNENMWDLTYINKIENEVVSETFDFLIIASGLHNSSVPNLPDVLDQSKFKG